MMWDCANIRTVKCLTLLPAGQFVPGASERCNTVYAWLQQLLQERLREGGLTHAHPIGSRMWQMLSEGYLQFEQCRQVTA